MTIVLVDKLTPTSFWEIHIDIIVISIQYQPILFQVILKIIETHHLDYLDQLVLIIDPFEKRFFFKDLNTTTDLLFLQT